MPQATQSEMPASTMEVLTLKEAAGYLRVSEADVIELATRQDLPGRQIGNDWRFLKHGLADWLLGRSAGGKATQAPIATGGPKGAPAPQQGNGLKPNQLRILRALAKGGTLTYNDIRAATGMKKGLSKAMGTPSKPANAPHTLLAKGLAELVNASKPYTFRITAAGKEAIE